MAASINAIYQKRSDEVARAATSITADTGTASSDPDYALTNLVDDNAAKVAKLVTTSGSLLFEYAAAQRIDIVALIHHTLMAGLAVTIQGNATNVWTSPSFAAAIVIPPWYATGTTRRWPINPWLDLTTVTPITGAYSASGFKFWRVLFGANDQTIQIAEVWFGSVIRRYDPNLEWGGMDSFTKRQITHETAYGIETHYPRGTALWQQSADLDSTDALDASLRDQWFDVDGRAYPWLLIPDGTINDAKLVHHATDALQVERNFINRNGQKWAFREAGRGLRPGA